MASSTSCNNQTWYPDSDVTHHLTTDIANLSQRSNHCGVDQIYMGNGQGLHNHLVGSRQFQYPQNPAISLSLNHLFLVPSITKKLVSAS